MASFWFNLKANKNTESLVLFFFFFNNFKQKNISSYIMIVLALTLLLNS